MKTKYLVSINSQINEPFDSIKEVEEHLLDIYEMDGAGSFDNWLNDECVRVFCISSEMVPSAKMELSFKEIEA